MQQSEEQNPGPTNMEITKSLLEQSAIIKQKSAEANLKLEELRKKTDELLNSGSENAEPPSPA